MDPGELDFVAFAGVAADEAQRRLPGIDREATQLILLLNRLAMLIVYDLESSVHRPSGWSWSGFRVLFALWLVGPMDAKTVAKVSGMSRAAISAVVKTLEQDGLVARAPHGADGRSVVLRLTEHGEQAIAEVFVKHNERERSWVEGLTARERATLAGLLRKLAARADEPWVRHR